MLRVFQILGYLAFIAGITAAGYLLLNNDSDMSKVKEFVESPLTAEQFAGNMPTTGVNDGSKAPLLVQAEALSLRLNPPAPARVSTPSKPSSSVPTQSSQKPRPSTPVIAKFDLVGTCVNHDNPSLSMVYVNIPGEGNKWVYEGETIGRLKIAKVKDNSVIYLDGDTENELAITGVNSEIVSLLKSDHPEIVESQAQDVNIASHSANPTSTAANRSSVTAANTGRRTIPTGSRARIPSNSGVTVSTTRPQAQAVRVFDPNEQKQSLESSIELLQDWQTGDEESDKTLQDAMKSLQKMMGDMNSAEKQE